jgi:hypothetical protein
MGAALVRLRLRDLWLSQAAGRVSRCRARANAENSIKSEKFDRAEESYQLALGRSVPARFAA